MKTKKSNLKENYYHEYTPLYDTVPEKLDVPKYKTEIFSKYITHREILKEYNIEPYTINEVFGVAADISEKLKKGEWRIVYFDNNGTLCRFGAFRGDGGQLSVDVTGSVWTAGAFRAVVCVSARNL